MRVRLEDASQPHIDLVLKMFDSLFTSDVRDDLCIAPWDKNRETQYLDAVHTGEVQSFAQSLPLENSKFWWCIGDSCSPDHDASVADDENRTSDEGHVAPDRDDKMSDDDNDSFVFDRTPVREEAYLMEYQRRAHSFEVRAYLGLRHLQGRHIPLLIAEEAMALSKDHKAEYGLVPGIIIEYIPGCTLAQFLDDLHPRQSTSLLS